MPTSKSNFDLMISDRFMDESVFIFSNNFSYKLIVPFLRITWRSLWTNITIVLWKIAVKLIILKNKVDFASDHQSFL